MRRHLGLAGLLISLLVFGNMGVASADVNNFTITDFTAHETLSRNNPHGTLHIVEHLNIDFTDNNHGILRAIPQSYKKHSLNIHVNAISSDSGAPASYTTYTSGGNLVLKIGDPNQTVTGPQEYTIDYMVQNVITFYKDHDELYWDINGDQWQQPFERVTTQLIVPNGLKLSSQQPVCFAGSRGSQASNCVVNVVNNLVTATTTTPLTSGQTLTLVTGFQKGYFAPYTWHDTLRTLIGPLLLFTIPLLLLGGGTGLYWWKRGRDAKGTGIIVPQYDAPDNLTAPDVGVIEHFKLENRDITAIIIGLAIKKYLRIIETNSKGLLGGANVSYSLQLLNTDWTGLNAYEAMVMAALFSTPEANMVVNLSDLKNDLYMTATTLKRQVPSTLTTAGYFRSNPINSTGLVTGVITVGVFGAIWMVQLIHNFYLIGGLLIGGIIAALFISALPARTAKGVAAKEHIEGLKLYLNVAEKDRLEKLQGPQAAYAAPSTEPQKTVELFEKLLPYAIALQVEQGWAAQFASLYTTPPDWYAGNWTAFNAGYLVGNISNGVNMAVATAFSAPTSSGSSGFGGGGFSGGGGGGGGGGGW